MNYKARIKRPIKWQAIDAEITLSSAGARYYSDLQDKFAEISDLQSLTVEGPAGYEHRATNGNWNNETQFTQLMPPTELAPAATIDHYALSQAGQYRGVDDHELDRCITDIRTLIHSVIGEYPTTMSYPNGVVCEEMKKRFYAGGFTSARCGYPRTTDQPDVSYEHGLASPPHVNYYKSWDYYNPMNLCRPEKLRDAIGHCASAADMNLLLNETDTPTTGWNATKHANYYIDLPSAYAGSDLITMMKAENTWTYTSGHGSEHTAQQIGWLIDALQSAGSIWISDLATISAYADARHEKRSHEFHMFQPDGSYGSTPWNGNAAAFSICYDMASNLNFHTIADELKTYDPDIRFSVCGEAKYFLDQDATLTRAKVIELYEKGNVDIGAHGYLGCSIYPRRAVVIKNTDHTMEGRRKVEVYDDNGTKKMRFYKPAGLATANWYDPITQLPEFNTLFVADDLSAGTLTSISAVEGSILTSLSQADSEHKPTVVEDVGPAGDSVINFDSSGGAGNYTYIESADGDTHLGHIDNGVTLFAVYKAESSDELAALFGKYGNAEAQRECRIQQGRGYVYAAIPETIYGTYSPNSTYTNTDWHISILTCIPTNGGGSGLARFYVDGTTITDQDTSDPIAQMNLTGDEEVRCGVGRHQDNEPYDGYLVCWGAINTGYADGNAAIATIYNTLNDHYGVVS